MYEVLKSEGKKAVSAVKSEERLQRVDVREVVLEGHPINEIMSSLRKTKADLIVMGDTGKNRLDRFLGSVAEKVVRGSKVPVMVVRSGEKT
jgi:nucleotide-binding universal stress UspA family protein